MVMKSKPQEQKIDILSYYKTNEMHSFLKFTFGMELYMFRRGFCVHHQESSTVYTAICICHTGYADCLLTNSQHNLYVLLCIQY